MQKDPNTSTALRVLVTGAGGPAGIVALRLLARQGGVHTVGADIDPLASGQLFAHEYTGMAAYRPFDAYRDSLHELIKSFAVDVVVPTVHEELPFVHAALAGTLVNYVLSPQETLMLGDDKHAFFVWATRVLPELTPVWQRADEPLRLADPELFVKPVRGRGGRGCRKVHRDEITFLRDRFPEEAHDLLVFEYLPGTEWTVDVYVRGDGVPVYVVPRERIGLAGGISIKGRTVRHEEVIRRTLLLLERLRIHGPACIQWKADQNGVPKLVEVNPRLGGGTLISVAGGVDPMRCMLDELQGKTTESLDWQEVTVVGWLDYKVL